MRTAKLDAARRASRRASSAVVSRDRAIYEAALEPDVSLSDIAYVVGLSKPRVHQIVREQTRQQTTV